MLSAAYAARDADAAASAHTRHAGLHYRYANAAPEDYRGRNAIAGAFRAFFAGINTSDAIQLDFRMSHRGRQAAAGVYRMRIGQADYYGRFDLTFARDGRFARDTSSDATRADFEALPALQAAQ